MMSESVDRRGWAGLVTPKFSHSCERHAGTFRVSILPVGLATYHTLLSYGAWDWLGVLRLVGVLL